MQLKSQNKTDMVLQYVLAGEKRARSLRTVCGKSQGQGSFKQGQNDSFIRSRLE